MYLWAGERESSFHEAEWLDQLFGAAMLQSVQHAVDVFPEELFAAHQDGASDEDDGGEPVQAEHRVDDVHGAGRWED